VRLRAKPTYCKGFSRINWILLTVPLLSNNRDESYWLGVRDALRMIDSFVAWSRRNPARAKKIDDFVDDALIAVNKRCKSCLSQALGISFAESDEEEAAVDFGDSKVGQVRGVRPEAPSPLRATSSERRSRDLAEPMEEEPLAPPELAEEMHDEVSYAESPLSEMPDMSRMGSGSQRHDYPEETREETARDFLSEFHLEEPSGLEVDRGRHDEELPSLRTEGPSLDESESDEEFRAHEDRTKESAEVRLPEALGALEDSFSAREADISLPRSDDEYIPGSELESLEKAHDKTTEGFTWEEYERTVSSPPLPEEPKIPSRSPDSTTGKPSSVWSPYDESSDMESEMTESTRAKPEETEEEEDESKPDAARPSVKAPPPPPRPESEESEEERKKRARRLFFGS
jgi:hypothetical protein